MTALDLGTVLVLHKTSLLAGAGGLLPAVARRRAPARRRHPRGRLPPSRARRLSRRARRVRAISAETWRSSSLALAVFAYTLIYCGIRRLDRPAGRALWLLTASPVVLAVGLLTPVFDDNTTARLRLPRGGGACRTGLALSLIRAGRRERLASRAPLAFALGACGLVYGVQFPLIALGFSSPGSIAIGFAVTMMLNFSIAALVVSFVRGTGRGNGAPAFGDGRAHRRPQPPWVFAMRCPISCPRCSDAASRPRPLQVDQRPLRPCRRRRGADAPVASCGSVPEPGEILARLGGEEFVVFLPHGGGRAVELAETARARLADAVIDWRGEQIAVSTSVGVALASPRRSEGREALLARADAALYRAKRLGRNRVEIDGAAPSDGAERPSTPWQGVTPHFAPG